MKFNLKKALLRKRKTIGSWISIGNSITTEIMCQSDFDWLVIDLEHTGITNETMVDNIRIIDMYDICPVVRVPSKDSYLIKIALDSGARGIVVPMVNCKEDAEVAVQNVYYNPIGNRGTGLYRAHKYGSEFEHYRKNANKNTALIVQIEHYEAVNNLEEILSVDGVDGFIIGPYDLTASINKAGCFNSDAYLDLLTKVEKYLEKDKKPGGYHIVHSEKSSLDLISNKGYKFIAYGVDMIFLSEKLCSIREDFN